MMPSIEEPDPMIELVLLIIVSGLVAGGIQMIYWVLAGA